VRGCRGVLEEAVGLGIRRDSRVGVDVDDPGEDQHPGRIDHPVRACRQPLERWFDRADPSAVDSDVRRS
jgi:hypothetical protein